MRPIFNAFNWKYLPKIIWRHIWRWKYPIILVALIGIAWWISGCALLPAVANQPEIEVPSASQSLIDKEVETVRTSNEAYRKLRAAGCDREDLKLKRPIAVRGKSFYEYECRLSSGAMVKLYKLNGEWIIVPGE